MRTTLSVRTGGLLLAATLAAGPLAARLLPFLPGTDLGTIASADSLMAGDFDRDGDVDFVASYSSTDLVVWEEDTGAGFVEHTITNALDQPVDLAPADVDCDGDLDLVVAVRGTSEVVWERNDTGATSWVLGGVIGSHPGILSVGAGDLTGNGTVDVATGGDGADDLISWTHSTCSAAAWTSTVVSNALQSVQDVAIADTNRDGRLDVVGAGNGWGPVVWENAGGGSFNRVDVGSGFTSLTVAVGDLDRDGDLDVASSGNAGEIAWWANPGGPGAWAKTTIGTVSTAKVVALGDIDGDGDLDAVGSSAVAQPLSWWDNVAGDGSLWSAQELDASPGNGRALLVADVGPDGDADVVSAATAAGVRLYENVSTHRSADLGLIGWTFHDFNPGVGQPLADLETADVDGDGRLDLVAVWRGNVPNDCFVIWYEGLGPDPVNGILRFGAAHQVRQGGVRFFESVALGDVNGDGELDAFIGGNLFAGQGYAWCRNDGGGTSWSCFDFGANHWLVDAAELADLDADGDLDVVAVSQQSFGGSWVVLWYERTGNPTVSANWVRHDIASDGPFDKLEVADLDRDGDLDVIAGADWWRNDGGAPIVWTAQTVPFVFSPPVGSSDSWAVGDVDGDGTLDMVAQTSSSGIAWVANHLPGAWVASEFFSPTPDKAPDGDFTLADLDRDGDLDLVAGMLENVPPSPPVRRLSWFESDAPNDPFAWSEHPVDPTGDGADHLQAFDFDRDGDPDLAMAAGNELQSWLNAGGQFALEAHAVQPPSAAEGTEVAMLAIDALHRGRDGEPAMELSALSLLFEKAAGQPLSQTEYDSLVDSVRLYRDDGSGGFDAADQQVGAAPALTLTSGRTLFELDDDLAGLQHTPAETPAVYFLSVSLAPAAAAAALPLRVTHTPGVGCTLCVPLPALPSAAEDAPTDLPLTQEVSTPATAALTILPGPFASGFADGFESGAMSAWAGHAP